MYVIERTDQGGGYVAVSGSQDSYTKDLAKAQPFATREAAKQNCCPGNEVVREISDIMPTPIW